MTNTNSSGGEPEMPFDVELYLATELQRFSEEFMGEIPPARTSVAYLGYLSMASEGHARGDDQVVLSAFSGFLLGEFADMTEQHGFMVMVGEADKAVELSADKARMFGDLLLHGLETMDWAEHDDAMVTPMSAVCWSVAQHLVDAIDSFDRLRGYAIQLKQNGLAA